MVCGDCVKLASIYWEAKPSQSQPTKRLARPLPRISVKRPPAPTVIAESLELVDGFGILVRRAREKLGLSHEDLGRKIGEKVSVLRKIEKEKMTPDHRLADKLGHALRVKLLVPTSEPKTPSLPLSQPRGVTLGEIAKLKKKKKEETEEREPS